MVLLNKHSTFDLFYNKNIVTKVWTTYDYMTVKIKGVTIKTTHKANLKGYGEVLFDE